MHDKFETNNKQFISGLISGVCQTLIGHPLDTIKVLLQGNKSFNYNLKLFNGMGPVLLTNSLITGIQFHAYENYSPISLGLISAVIITPIEYYKIQKQTFNIYPKTIPKGFGITFLREVIALNCYFNSYKYLENRTGIFIAGGIAGATSWLLTYQIDTIKTRIQSGNTFIEAINKKQFNKGLLFCLFRGFLVNGFGYLGVSSLKNI